MKKISIQMNAARVCNAIARIGYEPHSALMDIIDNSVAASALKVHVFISLVDGKTINQRNNVSTYRIIDDGKGMNEVEILNAFKLGSDANYGKNSLSKYGMGLKSAGFSLGTRIQIVSKKQGALSRKYFLDRKLIEDKNEYFVCVDDMRQEERSKFDELLAGGESGTVIEITGCNEIYHASAKTTIEKLKHRLGVTYFPFLAEKDDAKRLSITLGFPGEESYKIEPVDILFERDALSGFDPETYSASVPCYAFNEDWSVPIPGETQAQPIKLTVVTFPKDGMAGPASPLTDDEKAGVRSYKISRENKGFFVYRNGRLIRWGDDLGDIVGKDAIGLRVRMELTTEHDDLLHVDVSKQRLEMDDETHCDLDRLMRLPRKQAKDIFKFCDDRLRVDTGEGVVFSNTADSVPEDDPVEEITPPDPVVKRQRAKKIEDESKQILEEVSSEDVDKPEEEIFKRVRYSDALNGMNLWSTQKDAIQGTFVLINRRHSFYQTILSNFDDSSPERLALEAVIFCCAVGENKTYENLTSLNDDHIRKILERYHTVLSYNIGEWANGNQHLFEK